MGGQKGSEAEALRELVKEFLCFLKGLEGVSDEVLRYLKLVRWLHDLVSREGLGRVVVTGGFAVEVLTGRVYRTADVDLIVEGAGAAELIEALLKEVGERVARGYLLSKLYLETKSIDIVSTVYDRGREPLELIIEDGEKVLIDPPEHLITTYLAGWKFWESTEDRDKALWLLTALWDILDHDYLKLLAKEKNVLDKLNELQNLTAKILHKKPKPETTT